MLRIQQAGSHIWLCSDDAQPDRGLVIADGETIGFHTVAVVTTEEQLLAVLALYPGTAPERANVYRIAAGLPIVLPGACPICGRWSSAV